MSIESHLFTLGVFQLDSYTLKYETTCFILYVVTHSENIACNCKVWYSKPYKSGQGILYYIYISVCLCNQPFGYTIPLPDRGEVSEYPTVEKEIACREILDVIVKMNATIHKSQLHCR